MSAYYIPGTNRDHVVPHGVEGPIHLLIHPSSFPPHVSPFFPPSLLLTYLPTKICQVPTNVKHTVVNKAVTINKVFSKVIKTAKSLIAFWTCYQSGFNQETETTQPF